jgi:tRNA A-37 threonylcarbamoyl transferase component Bud32
VIAAGQSIGNYRILSKIGTGGMGAVYLAEHPLIGKRVALKVIHRELANNRDVVSRFFQEARSVNKIGNEHIVEIHDFGVTPEGDHFFIMEYLEGRTLASILSHERSLDIMRSLHVGAQIATALAAAHAAGIIHRDLKPDNIMLMPRLGDQDFVKVLDFGLAKVFSAATAVKTAAGVLLGTPQYMSPEACESKGDVDHRTDIYALGVLLFQMMTGVLPFDGESMGEVLVKQVTALPPVPRALNPAVPPSVEQILLRCLAKRVDARFATMLQLREALLDPEAYLRGSPPIAPARSVGPGEAAVDAKTVMVHAAQLHKTRIAAGNPLPLPAPAMSMSGQADAQTMIADSGGYPPLRRATTGMPALAPSHEPKMNTMRIATPAGYSSRPPRKVWPVVLAMGLLAGLGGGALAVALSGRGNGAAKPGGDVRAADGSDPSVAVDPSADRTASGGSTSGAGNTGSGAAASAAGTGPASGTGSNAGANAGSAGAIAGSGAVGTAGATGGSSAGGATGGSTAGGTGGASTAGTGGASTAGTGGSSAGGATSGSSAVGVTGGSSAAGANVGSGATGVTGGSGAAGTTGGSGGVSATGGSRVTGANPDAVAAGRTTGSAAIHAGPSSTAHLSIDSVPPGAAVSGPDGATLGRTPIKVDWPISDRPVTFELRLPGYKKKQKQTVVNSNTALHIELERVPVIRRTSNGGAAKPGSGGNGLMRPDE